MTTREEIEAHEQTGAWRQLEHLALQMIDDAQQTAGSEMEPVLGGGTRLMLELRHRISDDIDIFLRDPQWLGYLTPRLNDRFAGSFTSYDEGATSLKLRMPHGEIDFIVSMRLLDLPNETSPSTPFALEPMDEVLAKKLFYRGWSLTPRDLFDWKVLHDSGLLIDYEAIGLLTQPKLPAITTALTQLSASAPARLIWESIKAPVKPALQDVVQWAHQQLQAFSALPKDRSANTAQRTPLPRPKG